MYFNPEEHDENNVGGFKTPEPGKYLCKLVDVTADTTKNGDAMWKTKFEIIQTKELKNPESKEDYEGSYLFDNIINSKAAGNRAKLILSRLGADLSRAREFDPDEIMNKLVIIEVEKIEKYKDKNDNEKEKAIIAFAGYEKVELNGATQPSTTANPTASTPDVAADPLADDVSFPKC